MNRITEEHLRLLSSLLKQVVSARVTYVILIVLSILLHIVVGLPYYVCESMISLCAIRIIFGHPLDFLNAALDSLFEKFEKASGRLAKKVTDDVVEGLTTLNDTIQDLDAVTVTGLATNFMNHKVAISACVGTAATAESAVGVGAELIKVASMLGFEKSVVPTVVNTLLRTGAQAALGNVIERHGLEDSIPLLATGMAITGQELGILDVEPLLARVAKNTKDITILVQHTRKVLEQAGVLKPTGYVELIAITKKLEELREEHLWVATTLAVNANLFNKVEESARLDAYKSEIDKLVSDMRVVGQSKLKETSLYTEAHFLLVKAVDMLQQVALIRATCGTRQVPVGVCILGESHIGKSQLVPELVRRVQAKLAASPRLYPRAHQWQIWNMQQRDEYDTGYCGQEVAYMDDGWSDKANKDHPMWLTFISPAPVGTVQAALNQKGTPFQAKLCIVTCNKLPRTSVTIDNVNALWNRFPITVKAKKVGRVPSSGIYDPNFSWLSFSTAPMGEYVNNPGNEGTSLTGLDQLVDRVVTLLFQRAELYQSELAAMAEVVVQHADEEPQPNILAELRAQLGPPPDPEAEPIPGPSTRDESELTPAQIARQRFEQLRQKHLEQSRQFDSISEVSTELDPGDPDGDGLVAEMSTEDILQPVSAATPDIIGKLTRYQLRALQQDFRFMLRSRCLTEIEEFRPWYLLLQHKSSKQSYEEWRRSNDDVTPFQFISALSIWEIMDGKTEEFIRLYALQPIIRCRDHLGTEYVWGPRLCGGTRIIVLDAAFMRNAASFSAAHRYTDEHLMFVRTMNRLGIALLCDLSLPFAQAFLPGIGIPWWVGRVAAYSNWHPPRWGEIGGIGGVAINTILTVSAPIGWPLRRVVDTVSNLCCRFADPVVEQILSLLEVFGINITPGVESAVFHSTVAGFEIIAVSIVALFCYLLYLIYKRLTAPKKSPLIQHGRTYSGKPGKRGTVLRAKSGKRVPIRQHGDEATPDALNVLEDDFEPAQLIYDFVEYGHENDVKHALVTFDLTGSPSVGYNGAVETFDNGGVKVALQGDGHIDVGIKRIYIDSVATNAIVVTAEKKGTFDECCSFQQDVMQRAVANFSPTKIVGFVEYEWPDVTEDEVYMYLCFAITQREGEDGIVRQIHRRTTAEDKDWEVKVGAVRGVPFTKPVTEIVQCSLGEDISFLRRRYEVNIRTLPIAGKPTWTAYGLVSQDMFVCNAHAFKTGDVVTLTGYDATGGEFEIGIVTHANERRDLAFGVIMPVDQAEQHLRQACVKLLGKTRSKLVFKGHPSILKHMITFDELQKLESAVVAVVFPRNNNVTAGRLSFRGDKYHQIKDGPRLELDYLQLNGLTFTVDIPVQGDSGGMVVTGTRSSNNLIIGLYAAKSDRRCYSSYITVDDFTELEQHAAVDYSPDDPWKQLVYPVSGPDTPDGPAVKSIGTYVGANVPVSRITKWNRAPWTFQETVAPPPLTPSDPRIEKDLPRNKEGKPSLLLLNSGVLAEEVVEPDRRVVDYYVEKRIVELAGQLTLRPCASSYDELIEQGLNGHPLNEHVKGMNTNAAAGLPWQNLPGMHAKSDMLSVDPLTGHVAFRDDPAGTTLRKRVKACFDMISKNERPVILTTTKLKDQCIKHKHVANGKVRVYNCVPVEKIILDAALFGHFKEAYLAGGLDLDHAVGIDPNSVDWDALVRKLKIHPNYLSLDFSQYDKRMHSTLIAAFYRLVDAVIQELAPDDYSTHRSVMADLTICTWLVDFTSVYETTRGNKSGDYLTTILNSEVNRMYSFLAWTATTGKMDYTLWQANTVRITFGDDKLESVSDEYKSVFNYHTIKDYLATLKMEITTDFETESGVVPLEQLTFLKRTIQLADFGYYVAPLAVASIESPFTWTQNSELEFVIWENMVEDALHEAVLHGRVYYEWFRRKLTQCRNPVLRQTLAPRLLRDWHEMWDLYKTKYVRKRH
ncbi:MAG: polymerase protein [Apis nora virus 2]|nr:MAG: polymerase protein [Apis nora virus 2]